MLWATSLIFKLFFIARADSVIVSPARWPTIVAPRNDSSFRRVIPAFLVPFEASIAARIFQLAIFQYATQENLEGDFDLAAFVGALSFAPTGPVAGIVLTVLMRVKTLAFWKVAGLFLPLSVPVLSFQVVSFPTSILPLFFGGGPWRMEDTHHERSSTILRTDKSKTARRYLAIHRRGRFSRSLDAPQSSHRNERQDYRLHEHNINARSRKAKTPA